VERIDLYQVHWPAEDGTPLEEYWQVMVDLRTEGKVRAVGLSNHGLDQLEAAEKIGHLDSLQPPFSAIRRGAAGELAWCHENGTGAIVYSPMQSGLLTGAFTAERVAALPADDWRRSHPEFTTNLDRNLAFSDALEPIARRHGVTRGAVAVAWTLAWPGVTGAIVGARRPEQIDGWISAADLRLTPEDLDEISDAITRTGVGDGPTRP
jgi:aryl-alcohol dehydrogenase-like predicted oxidoreductase